MLGKVSLQWQRGFLMLVAILWIMVIGFLGLAVAYMFASGARSTSRFLWGEKALYLAESGLQQATYALLIPTLTSRSACSGLSINGNLGAGAYSVSASGPYNVSSPTTVNGALTASATTIPVLSTANYQNAGTIMIDNELIAYTSIDATDFNGATRGTEGSTASTHASGTAVGQNQCTITSQGGVSSLSPPSNPGDPFAKRVLQIAALLQDGWLVADQASNSFSLARWNKPSEIQWTNESISSTDHIKLTAISMLSSVDGWAVGLHNPAGETLLHWNGNAWSLVSASISGNPDLNGVSCNNRADCWAVGQNHNNYPTILHYDGTSWSLVTPTAQANATANEVFCNNSSDCWLVGQALGNYPLIEHWNGSNWSLVTLAATAKANANSVFCNNTSDCWMVGQNVSGNALIENYTGGSWSFVALSPAVNQTLNSVYCNNSSDCWAVGQHLAGNLLFIVHWNGSTWSSSSVSGAADLYTVACTKSNDCWAAGSSSTLLHWNGSAWTAVTISGSFPSVTIYGLGLLGPSANPQSAWQEVFA